MAIAIVEEVNVSRGLFCVRCQDGTYRYYRSVPRELPRAGDTLSCPDERPLERRFCLIDVTQDNRLVNVLSSVHHLPRDVAIRMVAD